MRFVFLRQIEGFETWRGVTNASTGQPIGHPLAGRDKPVRAVAFSPDGRVDLAHLFCRNASYLTSLHLTSCYHIS